MSAYLQQEFDFILRTQKIIEQYVLLRIDPLEKYEVTLLINCFVGLLILPQQLWFNNLPETTLIQKEWGINPTNIKILNQDDTKSVKNVAKHLRNSVSHYHFSAFNDSNSNIKGIIFTDQNLRGKENFKAELSIEEIKIFIIKLSNFVLETMKKHEKNRTI